MTRGAHLSRLKRPLFAVLALFTGAALYTAYLTIEQEHAMRRLARYDDAFDAGQGAIEFMRLQAAVAALPLPGTTVTQDEIALRYAILQNRLKVLNRPSFRQFLDQYPGLVGTLDNLAAVLARIGPKLNRLDTADAVATVVAELTPLDAQLTRMSSFASNYVGDHIAADQERLSALHWASTVLFIALFICGLALIALLLRQNRSVRVAHDGLRTLTHSLSATTEELSIAHQAAESANRQLEMQNAHFHAALNNMLHGLCMVDAANRLIVCNTQFLELFGLTANDAFPGVAIDALFATATERAAQPRRLVERIRDEERRLTAARRGGSSFTAEEDDRALEIALVPMQAGGWVATYEDISERRRIEAQIAHVAHHDSLSGLPNRVLFGLRLDDALIRLREGRRFGVLLLDLDHFKDINDTIGHAGGDTLLQLSAQRLRACLREQDLVSRLGGDEFAILQTDIAGPEDSASLAERVVDALSQPFEIEGRRVTIGTSIGIALAEPGTTASMLLRNADMALYRAKADGRSVFRFFEAEMGREMHARTTIANDLRDALAREQFELHYQPIVDIRTGRLVQFEALLRWRHPELGMISPARFIPIAEDTRMIVPIGEWVLWRACEDARAWSDGVRVAVNLSPRQFRGTNIVAAVRKVLGQVGLEPRRLELEITETALLHDSDGVLSSLHDLRALGISVALDDFGTGYSSLSYLRRFPFDKVKVDQSFVRDLGLRSDSLAIIHSVVGLATRLGMATTAEGVETQEQLELVREAGCTLGQGYFFDRPRTQHEVCAALAADSYCFGERLTGRSGTGRGTLTVVRAVE
ncbi:MAG TPA: EAL domain-containing protein [Acetobacteraceae bacterium]|nr:EAL domain-containing protein [Acetobacteraceae bacterium]